MELVNNERVIAYIDGFNLYNGLKDSGFNRFKWLDIQLLVENLLKTNQTLINVKYFTTLVTNDSYKRERQKSYVGALSTKNLVKIYYGKFQREEKTCSVCGSIHYDNCEKMTDVNLSTHIMIDYFEDNFDMAMIISGDTDLIPPIRYVNQNGKNKRAFVAFPPNRINDEVRNEARGSMPIGRKKLSDSQFKDIIIHPDGTKYERPQEWA